MADPHESVGAPTARPPDTAAPKRRRWLQSAALLVLILVGGGIAGQFILLSPNAARPFAPITAGPSSPGDREVETGNAAYDRGDYVEAVRRYAAAIAENKNLFAAYHNRGLAYLRLGNHQAALKDFSEALRIDEQSAGARIGRAEAFIAAGNPLAALADLDDAIRRDPLMALAWNTRGGAYEALGRYADALKDHGRAVELAAKQPDYHNDLAWLLATCPEGKVRDGRRAVTHAMRAIALQDDARFHDTLAAAHAESGEFAKAIEAQQRALAGKALGAKERAEMEARLALYRANKPYHGP